MLGGENLAAAALSGNHGNSLVGTSVCCTGSFSGGPAVVLNVNDAAFEPSWMGDHCLWLLAWMLVNVTDAGVLSNPEWTTRSRGGDVDVSCGEP